MLDTLLPACTLFPVVPDRCAARGAAETKLITQEEREHVGNDRKRSRDPASCSARVRPHISHRPGPLCRGGSLQDNHPRDRTDGSLVGKEGVSKWNSGRLG